MPPDVLTLGLVGLRRSFASICALADLGYGVLDTAMVETAAYCLERTTP